MKKALERFLRFGFLHPIAIPEGDTESHLFRAGKGQEKLSELAHQLMRDAKNIEDDPSYTDQGKRDRLKKLFANTGKAIAEIQRVYYEPLLSKLAELQGAAAKLRPQLDPTEYPALVLREQETRQMVAAMEPSQRHIVFQEAIERKDAVTVKAFLLAPKFCSLLNEQTLADGTARWMHAQNPALMDQLASVEETVKTLAGDIREITDGFNVVAGIEPDTRERLQNQNG